ncbi:MAG: hypothetical protein ACRDPR_12165 [Nocardioidaceae bacterium]
MAAVTALLVLASVALLAGGVKELLFSLAIGLVAATIPLLIAAAAMRPTPPPPQRAGEGENELEKAA